MYSQHFSLVVAATTFTAHAIAGRIQHPRLDRGAVLDKRQADDFPFNETSICLSYGIDFQDGGAYFIDSRSTESFTVVSQFADCEPDTAAYVLLVNDDTGDQVECSGVATTPDLTNVVSTCPITKHEMTSGEWSVLIIGNNGDGSPYAWQRDFELTVGVPTTSTTTSTVTFTQTTTPSTTVTSTSTITTTTSVPNPSTITIPAATKTITITPHAQTITSTKRLTRTINTWTKTQSKITTTLVPSCTIPARPPHADPTCHIFPTIISLPFGLTISLPQPKRQADNPASPSTRARARARSRSRSPPHARQPPQTHAMHKRSADAPTIYIQAPDVANTTTTLTAPLTTTLTLITLTTQTATRTDPPRTVVNSGTQTTRTTLPPSTNTVSTIGYTTVTRTRTMAVTWTYTTRVQPAPSDVVQCREEGGHFGIL